MPRISPYKIFLTIDEKKQLQSMACKYTSSYREVMRAKIILLAADGLSNKEIGQRLDPSGHFLDDVVAFLFELAQFRNQFEG